MLRESFSFVVFFFPIAEVRMGGNFELLCLFPLGGARSRTVSS